MKLKEIYECAERAHHIVEDESTVGQFEVFQQAVEFTAVECAPGTVQVVSGLCLLTSIIVVQKLWTNKNTSMLHKVIEIFFFNIADGSPVNLE